MHIETKYSYALGDAEQSETANEKLRVQEDGEEKYQAAGILILPDLAPPNLFG